MAYLQPRPEDLQALAAAPDEGPVVMFNLLRFRPRAEYPDGSGEPARSGVEAYDRYGELVTPLLQKAGARLVWLGVMEQMVIGPGDKRWDRILLVEYPTRAAFMAMVTDAAYRAASVHRQAALQDSRLIATRATMDAISPR